MVTLSTYIQIPSKPCVHLMEAGCPADSGHLPSPTSPDYFPVLIDTVNREMVANLATHIPGESFLLVFARGSMVNSRLHVAQTYWRRSAECFGLDEIVAELEKTYETQNVRDTIWKIKKYIHARVLRDRNRMGPAKLAIRLKKPPDTILTPAHYPLIEQFMNEIMGLEKECDACTKEIFLETDLGDARRETIEQFERLLKQFELYKVTIQASTLCQFLEILKVTGCLHPVMPVPPEALQQTAKLFGVAEKIARQLIYLLRFAWICRLDKPQNFSDFTFKGVVVVPQPDTAPGINQHGKTQGLSKTTIEQTENLLQVVFDSLHHTMTSHPALQTFGGQFPDVPVKIAANVMTLPRPLYHLFAEAKSVDTRLNFITYYQIGWDYLHRFITAGLQAGHFRYNDHTLFFKELSSDGWCHLLSQVLYLKIKIGKGGTLKNETISSLKMTLSSVKELLEAVVQHPDDENFEKCAWLFNETAKDDFIDTIRGVWMLKGK